MADRLKITSRTGDTAGFKRGTPEFLLGDTQPVGLPVSLDEGQPKQKLLKRIKAHEVGIIPESDRNPEIVYTKDGEATAAVVLLTFLLMKPEISDIVKSTGKPVICGDKLCIDLWRTFSNALDRKPYTEENILLPEAKGASQQYVGYADFTGPIAVTQAKDEHINEVRERTPNYYYDLFYAQNSRPPSAHIEHASRGSIAAVLDIQADPKKLTELMSRIQKALFLRRVPETLCHEIGHLYATENALISGTSNKSGNDLKRLWSQFISRCVDRERKGAQRSANPKNAKEYEYYFASIGETMAQLIGEALLKDTTERTGVCFLTYNYAQMLPESFGDIHAMVRNITPPVGYLQNQYEPPIPLI